MAVADIHVADAELAGRGGGAVFRHLATGHAADDRGVVGALDGDGHAAGGAVGGHHGEALAQALAHGKALHTGMGVVQHVAPGAVGAQGEAAVLAGRAGLGHEHGLAGVGVADVELAAGAEDLVLFDQAAVLAGDHRTVVAAVNGHGDDLGVRATLAVTDLHGEAVGDLLTGHQALYRGA